MPLGWTVVYRRGAPEAPDYWDCAIPSYIEAEKAVRVVCGAEAVALICAFEPISTDGVRLLKLADGQVRRRTRLS
jgi:hypothetical protein